MNCLFNNIQEKKVPESAARMEVTTMSCTGCGAKLADGTKFCASCGKPTVHVPADGGVPQSQAEPPKSLGVVGILGVLVAVLFALGPLIYFFSGEELPYQSEYGERVESPRQRAKRQAEERISATSAVMQWQISKTAVGRKEREEKFKERPDAEMAMPPADAGYSRVVEGEDGAFDLAPKDSRNSSTGGED